MKKIVYPILLLVLTACKGNQQTTNNESAAIPVYAIGILTLSYEYSDTI